MNFDETLSNQNTIDLFANYSFKMNEQIANEKTILASTIAVQFIEDIGREVRASDTTIKLLGLMANENPSAEKYAEVIENSCREVGVEFEVRRVVRQRLENAIIEANDDRSVDAILVFYPVFGAGRDQYLQSCVSPLKDAEGLSHYYLFRLYRNIRYVDDERLVKSVIACTPLAVVKILEYCQVYQTNTSGKRLDGKTVAIINRSELIGRPLAALLANDGALVFSVDIDGALEYKPHFEPLSRMYYSVMESAMSLKQILAIADVVITGVPDESFKVSTDALKDGVVAVNFSRCENFEENIVEKASIFVPFTGKMTTIMLLKNLLRLRRQTVNKQTN